MNSPLAKYKLLETIGQGAYGTVYRAECISDHQLYAIKQIKQQTHLKNARNLNELKSFQALKQRSQYIVRLHELFCVDESVYLVFELIVGGSLYDVLESRHFSSEDAIKLLWDLLRGMNALHLANFMHRDLKPENIMYEQSEDRFKIGDLGCARRCAAIGDMTEYVGTRWYRAPEVLLRYRKYNEKSDIFSAGLIVCEAIIGKPLIASQGELAQAQAIFTVLGISEQEYDWFLANCGTQISCSISTQRNGHLRVQNAILENVRGCSLELASILSKMLEPVPDSRSGCADLLIEVECMNKDTMQMTQSLPPKAQNSVVSNSHSYKSDQIKQIKKVEDDFSDNNCLDDW